MRHTKEIRMSKRENDRGVIGSKQEEKKTNKTNNKYSRTQHHMRHTKGKSNVQKRTLELRKKRDAKNISEFRRRLIMFREQKKRLRINI